MSYKVPGRGIKKMSILAVLAIIFVLIMHIVMWSPIISESGEVREEREYHERNAYREEGYHSPDCSTCKNFDREIRYYNQQGAALWQNTITNCALIALCGAVVYGIGVMVESKQQRRPEEYYNNPMQ